MGDDAMLQVPDVYADDFRAALVEELAFDIDGVRTQRKELDEHRSWQGDKGILLDDLQNTLALLAEDAELAGRVQLHLRGPIELETTALGPIAHIFEMMLGKILAPRLADAFNTSPIDDEWAEDKLRPLVKEVEWAIDQAVNFHLRYWEERERKDRGSSEAA